MIGDNGCFTRTGRVPARWNRMIFYDGGLLHSGDIVTPERLTSDPATGRLSFNGFFMARRNARQARASRPRRAMSTPRPAGKIE